MIMMYLRCSVANGFPCLTPNPFRSCHNLFPTTALGSRYSIGWHYAYKYTLL